MMKNNLSPLDELRQEKEIVRKEVAESEGRLAQHWAYLSDNTSSLLFGSAVSGIASWFGFGHKPGAKRLKESDGSSGASRNIFGILSAYYPLIWEIAQPMLLRYAMNKVKSLFTRKKKKKRKNGND